MKNEWKRGMSYMWSSKAMRKAFFCGFDLLGSGGTLLFIALAMAVSWHVIFMVSGVLLLYLYLARRYKRRSGVAN